MFALSLSVIPDSVTPWTVTPRLLCPRNSPDTSFSRGSSRMEVGWNPLPTGFPDSLVSKESSCNAGDPGLIPGSGRPSEELIGYPLQYSGLENSMDYIVHGVTKSQT